MKKALFLVVILIFIALLVTISNFLNHMYTSGNATNTESGEIEKSLEINIENNGQEGISYTSNSGDKLQEILEAKNIINTEEEFNEVINSRKRVVVDFYTDWCIPCKIMEPIFDEVSKEYSEIVFYRINADEVEELSDNYNIMYIPTLILFENGAEIDRSIGQIDRETLIEFINQ